MQHTEDKNESTTKLKNETTSIVGDFIVKKINSSTALVTSNSDSEINVMIKALHPSMLLAD